ncbi:MULTISPECIES: hypothetical protein [unclassified Moraxella]
MCPRCGEKHEAYFIKSRK